MDKGRDSVNSWEARYAAEPDGLFGAEPSQFLLDQCALFKAGMSVLVVGDGEGRNGVWLAEQGLEVTSVDISNTALGRAQALADARGVVITALCVDILADDQASLDVLWGKASFNKAFDVVVYIFVHFPPSARTRVHQHMLAALKPGGLLLIEAYHNDHIHCGVGGPTDVTLLYDRSVLENDFSDVDTLADTPDRPATRILSYQKVPTDVARADASVGQGVAINAVIQRL